MGASREEMLIEANRRGLLTGDRKAAFDEAVKRGLISMPSQQSQDQSVPLSQFNDPRAAALTIGSSALAEPIAGLAGLAGLAGGAITGAFNPDESIRDSALRVANQNIEGTRDFLTIDPLNEASEGVVETVGKGGELATKAVRAPVAGLAGIGESIKEGSLDAGANKTRDIMERGIGAVAGDELAEAGAPPALSAAVEAIPTAIAAVLGLAGAKKLAPNQIQVADDLSRTLKQRGIDVNDNSPQNITRINREVENLSGEQRARVDTLRDVGIENPTRAQVTRSADDFQRQQEAAKINTPVRNELEAQEGQLSQTFDAAADATGGRRNTSGSTVYDEVVGRSEALDSKISDLYKQARAQSDGGSGVDLSRFANRVIDNLDSDGATDGLYSAIRGELRRRGVVDKDNNVIRGTTVDDAEAIRQFINKQFDPKNRTFANSEIRNLKNSLDDDVFASTGKDVFLEARKAKAEFEQQLSAAKISKFDKNNRSLLRDILENKINPEKLVDSMTTSTKYRATDLKQVRDYLNQTETGKAAWNDLRTQVMQNLKDRSFNGPEDANGIAALSRDKLEKALDKIGKARRDILFTAEENMLLNKLLAAAKVREPVRGTALGKGPSAQALTGINAQLKKYPAVKNIVESIERNREGQVILNGTVEAPKIPRRLIPGEAAVVPLAIGEQ